MQLFSPEARSSDASDLVACRALLRHGSRTFFAASLLLPRRITDSATALYAFCRLADDAIDVDLGRTDALAPLRERLARAYAGHPLPIPADRALAEAVARHAIPIELPEALLEGFEWDAMGRRYEDLGDLLDYAARVAGSVGAMMAVIMGARAPELVARACELGMAMQLSNIARDVGEDARAGRLYLPVRWLREVGIDADGWLARPVFSGALRAVVQRLLREADILYGRASSGIGGLPLSCRPGIRAARTLYAEIGHEVERRGFDSVSTRAAISSGRKTVLLARSLMAAGVSAADRTLPALTQARFLVDAVAFTPAPMVRRGGRLTPTHWAAAFDDRVAWLVALFARLEQANRSG